MSQSYSVSQVISLSASSDQHVNDLDKENEPGPRYETIGGVLFDTKYIWTANGPHFTVINSKTGTKVAAWNFGSVVKDYKTKVICVDELSRPTGKLPLLVIGLECDLTGGLICIFDITGSRVIRAIQINEKVASLHIINASYDKCPLPGPLRAFDGILAIGTAGGNVLLLDICRQICDEVVGGSSPSDVKDEINSCLIKTLFLEDIRSLELHKQVASKNGEHLAVHLNETDSNITRHFILKGPKGEDRVHVNRVEVVVSALHYCAQLGSLLVGYNFGAWQLWDLINLQLVYTSPIYEENIPVTQFAIQEPCDDPRAFCYVWVVYSNTKPYHTGFPVAVMYSLNYDSKEWHEGYGILYLELTSCAVRFQMDLKLYDERQREDGRQGASCVRLQAITKNISKGGSLQEHQEEMVSLCSIVWSGWSSNKSNTVSHTYMSLFDLNQWYKEQMPTSPRLQNCEGYITHVCLSKLLQTVNAAQTSILDMRMDINTLSQFFGSQKLEEHYHPSALAFELCALRECDVIFFNNQGNQRALLSELESGGPLSLIKPSKLFQQSMNLGLTPLFVEISSQIAGSVDCQRELLLSIALEQQLLGWLCRCASAWSNGSHSAAGCTLHTLLSWGWQRAHVLKYNADKLSVPLFDYSGFRLDSNTHNLLSNCARQLKNLATFFGYISRTFSQFMLHSDVVKQQRESLEMVSVHLEVLQWLLNVGLLPECPLSSYPRIDEFNRISAPYPVDSLINYYDERRAYLQSLNRGQFITNNSLLFIDNLIELECGGYKLQNQWEKDGGTGLYPPPSLQALLRAYLVDDVEISYKHCVIVYVFLDLAMSLDQSRYKPIITHLIKFPAVFQLSPSIIKITQAFWQLDHGDFSTAMEQLLDPLVCAEDLKTWHHRVALRSLLAQKQYSFALLYLQVRQPGITEVQDMCTILSLYVANNMLDEAFHFQRQHKSDKNELKLLEYFYRECDRKGEILSILPLPLTRTEEEVFMKYLKDVKHPKLQDLKMFYFIQQSRYMDAVDLNNEYNVVRIDSKGLHGQENVPFRDIVIKEYTNTLPVVSRSLMNFCQQEKQNLWKKVKRPEPFSVFVHNTKEQVKYKSTLINAAVSKAKETWIHPILNDSKENNSFFSTKMTTEDMPFLNTPKATPSESRLATPVIFPKITNLEYDEGDDGPSPPKRFKPSPRLPVTTPEKQGSNDAVPSVKLDTPIIKRKASKRSTSLRLSDEKFSVGTPQSILKVYNLVRNSHSPELSSSASTPEDLNTITANTNESSSNNDLIQAHKVEPLPRKRSFGITPRKPLPRTPRPAVRFDVSRASSESSITSNTSEPSYEIIHDRAVVHSPMDIIQKTLLGSSKNSSLSTDEVYYSPDASISSNAESKPMIELESVTEADDSKILNQQVQRTDLIQEDNKSSDLHVESPRLRRSYKRHTEEVSKNLDTSVKLKILQTPLSSPKTPRSRRSYKGFLPEMGIRSSPRLRKSVLQQEELESLQSQFEETIESESKEVSLSSNEISELQVESPRKSKIRGRRSLSRQVLEANTFLKLPDLSFDQDESSSRLLPSVLYSDTSQLDISNSKTEISFQSELTEKSTTVHTEEYKNVTVDKDLHNNSNASYRKTPVKKLWDTASVDSSSDNPLDMGYISDGMQPSTSASNVDSTNDLNIPFIEDKLRDMENSNENENISERISKDQQKENAGEGNISSENEILPDDTCDSDSDTVLVERDNVNDADNLYEDLSSNNFGSVDPQMNIFEISDDLDLSEVVVGEEKNVLEIDTNYTTSTNDEEVFADNSEVLSNVLAVTEGRSGQFESSEIEELNRNIQDVDEVTTSSTHTEEVKSDDEKENFPPSNSVEIIELDSSYSDNTSDKCSENSHNQSSNTSQSREESDVGNVDEEESCSENSSFVNEERSFINSDDDVRDERNEGLQREVLSDSESSIMSSRSRSDSNSVEREEMNTDECGESNDVSIEELEEPADNQMYTKTLDHTQPKAENKQVSALPEESFAHVETENVNSEEILDDTESNSQLESISVQIVDSTEDSHLATILEETSDQTQSGAQLTTIIEESTETAEAEDVKKTLFTSVEENNQPSTSKTPTSSELLYNNSTGNEQSASVEQVTMVEVPQLQPQLLKMDCLEDECVPTSTTKDVLSDIDIVDKTQNVKSPTNLTNKDESEIGEASKPSKSVNWLNHTDVLDATARQSGAAYIFKHADDSNISLSSINTTSDAQLATTDILDKSEDVSSRRSSNVFNHTDILDRSPCTTSGAQLETTSKGNQTDIFDRSLSVSKCKTKDTKLQDGDDHNDDSWDEIFKKNVQKSSTPARRSTRLSSLHGTSSSDQISLKKRTRRSISCTDSISTELEVVPIKNLMDQYLASPRKRTLRSASTDAKVTSKENENLPVSNRGGRKAASVTADIVGVSGESASPKKKKKSVSTKSESSAKENNQSNKTRKTKSTVTSMAPKTKLEEYSTTRRLTRRQANLLQKTLGTSQMNLEIHLSPEIHSGNDSDASESSERGPNIGRIDPINLLDKPTFEGKPDSEEEKTIQQSPSSSVPESPIGSQATRTLRSRSSLSNTSPRSEISTTQSLAEVGPSRKQKQTVKRAIAGLSSRKRSKSTDVVSTETSNKDEISPQKLRKTRRGSKESDRVSDISTISKTRSLVETKKPTASKRITRSSSLMLEQKETEDILIRRSERRSLLAKSELPQIEEEQIPETVNAPVTVTKRNLRKAKSTK